MDLRTRKIIRDNEGHYIIIRGLILQEDITILNICVLTNKASKYVKKQMIDLKGTIDRQLL